MILKYSLCSGLDGYLGSVVLYFSPHLEKLRDYSLQFFLLFPFLFFKNSKYMCIRSLEDVPQITDDLVIFKFFFSLYFILVVSIAVFKVTNIFFCNV